jgi:hypothetical protein
MDIEPGNTPVIEQDRENPTQASKGFLERHKAGLYSTVVALSSFVTAGNLASNKPELALVSGFTTGAFLLTAWLENNK